MDIDYVYLTGQTFKLSKMPDFMDEHYIISNSSASFQAGNFSFEFTSLVILKVVVIISSTKDLAEIIFRPA